LLCRWEIFFRTILASRAQKNEGKNEPAQPSIP
jgi:hypothetical protein